MKELRFDAADGVWRFAFAFDPNGAGPSSCAAATNQAAAKSAFTASLIDEGRRRALTRMSPGLRQQSRRKGSNDHEKPGPHTESN